VAAGWRVLISWCRNRYDATATALQIADRGSSSAPAAHGYCHDQKASAAGSQVDGQVPRTYAGGWIKSHRLGEAGFGRSVFK